MQKRMTKIVAILLSLSLLAESFSPATSVNAAKNNQAEILQPTSVKNDVANATQSQPEVVTELPKERTLNSNTYLLSDGEKELVTYMDDIRYKDASGKLVDYEPELVRIGKKDRKILEKAELLTEDTSGGINDSISGSEEKRELATVGEYAYVNKQGDSKQFFPETLSADSPIYLIKDNYEASIAPVSTDTKEVEVTNDTIEDAYEKEKNVPIDVSYEATREESTFTYRSMEDGVKESIVLQNAPESNIWKFELSLKGAYAKLDNLEPEKPMLSGNHYNAGLSFFDEKTNALVGGIEAPNMNDATGEKYSDALYYTLEETAHNKDTHSYLITLYADSEYLNAADTTYPVTIDPSLTWNESGNLASNYVLKSSPGTNYYS
nr:hypothetical protein [Lachnospiraceae bacterium]